MTAAPGSGAATRRGFTGQGPPNRFKDFFILKGWFDHGRQECRQAAQRNTAPCLRKEEAESNSDRRPLRIASPSMLSKTTLCQVR
jgi:hypothetical protein